MPSQSIDSPPRNRTEVRAQLFGRVADVQRVLDVSRSKAYQLLQEGAIASVSVGKSRRVVLASLDEYVARLMGEVA